MRLDDAAYILVAQNPRVAAAVVACLPDEWWYGVGEQSEKIVPRALGRVRKSKQNRGRHQNDRSEQEHPATRPRGIKYDADGYGACPRY